jgi:single-stranded-DNA-specific exonuclease
VIEALGAGDPVPELGIDGALTAAAATPDLAALLERIGPFGTGNAEPRFAFPGLRILRADVVGGAHVRLVLGDGAGAGRLKAMAFRALDGALGPALLSHAGAAFHIAGHLRADRWQGREGVQLFVDDAARAA